MSLSTARPSRKGLVAAAVGLAVVASAAAAASAAPSQPSAQPQASASPPLVVPKPASMTVGSGAFRLASGAHIVAASRDAVPVANALAGYLRPATGFKLQVVGGNGNAGDIVLRLGGAADPTGEAYQLTTTSSSVTVQAATPHGLYDGLQTIRQLLPPWINSPTVQNVDWTMPVVQIADHPRYTYRGVMLDIARHYESPDAVKRLIDQAAAYKINTFHLHLSDDQGFRIVINGFPNLTNIGGQGSVVGDPVARREVQIVGAGEPPGLPTGLGLEGALVGGQRDRDVSTGDLGAGRHGLCDRFLPVHPGRTAADRHARQAGLFDGDQRAGPAVLGHPGQRENA